jgi:hypothetical protein
MSQKGPEELMKWFLLASPFIAAILASVLTYWFGFRSKKQAIVLHERLRAFQAIQRQLALTARYCRAASAESAGGEFSRRRGELPADAQGSALSHWTTLQDLVDDNLHVLPPEPRQALEDVGRHLSGLSSMELALDDPSPDARIVASARGAYEAVASAIEGCIATLYKSLGLPR